MTETLTVRQASRELAEDHRRLHGLLDRVGVAADLRATAEALAELHAALTRHFTEEEKPGGLYDALGVCVPEFRSRLAALVDEHFRLAAFVRDLRERARGTGVHPGDEPRAEMERLVAALADHERREHELVEAVLGREA
jgi:hypothetical protein